MLCEDFDLLPKSSPTVPLYAYGLDLVVLTAFLPSASLSKNKFFDRLTEVKKAVKTTKSSPSAYKGTVGLDLGSKSKSLQRKGFCLFWAEYPSKEYG